MSGTEIVKKLDELLKDDKNFDTRAGLRFMTELVRDAFDYIKQQKDGEKEKTQVQNSIITRIGNVENGLNEFLELRKREQEKAETERTWWRRAFIAPVIILLINQIVEWGRLIAEAMAR
jgi:hypothetical protein